MTTETFIEKSRKVHGDKYDYSKSVYKGPHTKICIICPEHGEFWQDPYSHMKGFGCKKCAAVKRYNDDVDKYRKLFLKNAHEKCGDKYDYSKMNYVNSSTPVIITCPNHGDFKVYPTNFLAIGGCPCCIKEHNRDIKRQIYQERFIKKANEIHNGKYDYSKVNYVNAYKTVDIICPKHGVFKQSPLHHLNGEGCPKCANNVMSQEEFIEKSKEIHGDKYDYSKVKYIKRGIKVEIVCPKHGSFFMTPIHHLGGEGCPKCAVQVSKWENQIGEWLANCGVNIDKSIRNAIGRKEIDIYIPDSKIGIECDGLYWHSDKFCDKNYQLNKTFLCEQNGIRLIHIFEDEWNFHQDIVKSMLLDILDKIDNKIEAQKCQIKAVISTESDSFYNYNHIEGKCISVLNLGLYNDDTLVYLMSFNKAKDSNCYKITRFSSKIGVKVINGANILFNYFISKFKPNKVTAYVDKRWQNGDMFLNMNFKHICDTLPTCYDIFQRKRNVNKGNDNELNKIYDCGNMVFVWQ